MRVTETIICFFCSDNRFCTATPTEPNGCPFLAWVDGFTFEPRLAKPWQILLTLHRKTQRVEVEVLQVECDGET